MQIDFPFKTILTLLLLQAVLTLNGQVENGCITIDFETIPNTTPQSGTTISTQFKNSFGLTFSLENGSAPVLAMVGPPVEAFGSAWGDDTPAPGVDIGQFFITDDGSLSGLVTSPLILTFDIPIDTFAGCILDMDLSEVFFIEAFDEFNNVILSETIVDGDPGTGDGQLTCWGFNLPGCVGAIYKIRFSGTRTQSGQFGLGMDNFNFCYTGANIEFDVKDFSCDVPGEITILSTTSETYEYSLDQTNFTTDNIFEDLDPGLYVIFIRDSDGCISSVSVEILDIVPYFSNVKTIHTSCDEINGEIELIIEPNNNAMVSVNGGTPDLQTSFSDLPSGDYHFSVIDENGCKLDTMLTIDGSLPPPEITAVESIPDYCNDSNGSITVTAMGGVGELMYSINNDPFQSSPTFEGLPPAIYEVTVIDEDLCMRSESIEIDLGDEILASVRKTKGPDCLELNGEIELNISGGNGNLTFIVDGIEVPSNTLISDLNSGIHEITLIDEQGCETMLTVVLPCSSCELYFPNVIIPDFPGPNEKFKVSTNINFDANVKLYNIYDRWGGLVYSKSNFSIHTSDDIWWGGYFDNTKVVLGVYTYLTIIEDPCGEEEVYVGDVTVLR
ncbi:MAG: hypothetical protein HKO66_05465 [Saprospiraceae bacterium]|nr:hypothetical protein [Saprospiraceae bacterium]NNL91657.1 hypothetical protein [Saprospiraceae bacterium]